MPLKINPATGELDLVMSPGTGVATTSIETDSGTATPTSGGAITVAGGAGISTSGASSTVTVTLNAPIDVPEGGTGVITLTDGGVILGSGTSAVTSLSQATNGQLVIGSTGADPVLGTLTSGEGISVTEGVGSISIATTENLELLVKQSGNALSTGILSGGVATVNGGDSAKFDLSSGTGYVIDNYTDPQNPSITRVSFGPFVAQTVTDLATEQTTFISINSAGSIVQQTTEPTQPEKRDLITLSVLGHPNNTSITAIGPIEEFSADIGVQFSDLSISIGNINREGNVYIANGANLNLDKSAGETFRLGANFISSKKNPNIVTDPSDTGLTFTYLYQDGSGGVTVGATGASIDPTKYDDGSGTLASVMGNRWSIQRITWFTNSNLTFVEYGQAIYNSKAGAESAINTEVFNVAAGLSRGSFRSWLVVKSSSTDLSDTAENLFVEAGKFGASNPSGGGGGGALTDLQGSYDNSVTPEITLDTTRNGLDIIDASSPIGADLFTISNNAQTTDYFSVDVNGAAVDGALTITTPLAVTEGGGDDPVPQLTPFCAVVLLAQQHTNL